MSAAPVSSLHVPAHRLAGFYFFYYATVGAFMPYWPPYLVERGFSPVQMGVAFALMGVMRTVVPLAWGTLADRSGRRMALIRWSSVASLLLFLAIPFSNGVFWVGALMLAYTLFWHALLPQFEVVAFAHLNASGGDYARVRLWGSVGFIASVLGLGWALERTGIIALPWLVGTFWVFMVGATWGVPEVARVATTLDAPRASLRRVLRRPEVIALLLVCFASQLSFAPYYNFFTLFLERHGYSRSLAGTLWALGVVAEVGMFMAMGRLISRFGARRLMLVALAVTVLRWTLTATLVDAWSILLLAQLSHALTFGTYHAVAMHYVQRLFPPALLGRGQAMYNAAAYGIGGSIGSLGAGYLWGALSPEAVFLLAALVALLGFWIGWKRLPEA